MDKQSAISATNQGAIAALICAAITLAAVGIAIYTDAQGAFAIWNDPFSFVDVGLLLLFAFGVYKKSRIAAVFLLVYFIASKTIIFMETQNIKSILISFIFFYFYARAVQGSFVFQTIQKQQNPNRKIASKWWLLLSIPSVLLIVAVTIFSVLSTTGFLPSTRVLAGEEIFHNDIQLLKQEQIISTDDEIKYFYSHGGTSILESGNLFTQDRVILYFTDENGDIEIHQLYFKEIVDVLLEEQGDSLNDSIYVATTNDPDRWILIHLSTEQKGDEHFVKALKEAISVSRK